MKRDLLCVSLSAVHVTLTSDLLNMTACTFIIVSQFSCTDLTVPRWRSLLINAIGNVFFLA